MKDDVASETSAVLGNAGLKLAALHSNTSNDFAVLPAYDACKRLPAWVARLAVDFETADSEFSRSADWFLDNEYQLHRAIKAIAQDLNKDNIALMPVVKTVDCCLVRNYDVARSLVEVCEGKLTPTDVIVFLKAYQTITHLTLAELWLLPIMIRLIAIELIGSHASAHPQLTSPPFRPIVSQIPEADLVACAFLSLNSLAKLSWTRIVEAVSLVHAELCKDPSGIFSRMDDETQASYVSAVEAIARGGTQEELDVALQAIALAGNAEPDTLEEHVGYWLKGKGRLLLESRVIYRLDSRERLNRLIARHAGLLYGFTISLLIAVGIALPAFYLRASGAGFSQWSIGLSLVLLPATILGTAIANWLVTKILSPTRLPALDFPRGIDHAYATAVVVPVIVGSAEEVDGIIRKLEVRYSGNSDPALEYVLLSDLTDSQCEREEGDESIEDVLQAGIARLNRRYPKRPFHLLHRRREFNSKEACWMGWERKRGKLAQFNRFVLDKHSAAFSIQEGDTQKLHKVKYAICVDADTMLPPETARALVGTIAHPMNRAVLDTEARRVVKGYGILQPRMETITAHGSGSWFSRFYAGDGMIDIYSRAVSDVYQDLFGSGIFCGKGIYDIAVFETCLRDRIPENTVLSHDLFEGIFARAGLATHIVLYEDYPGTYLEHAHRAHRWIRGDWQLLPWLGWNVRAAHGDRVENPFTVLDKWKIVDNMRRSLVPPALMLLFIGGWIVLPGSAVIWTILAIAAPAIYLIDHIVNVIGRSPLRGFKSGMGQRLAYDGGRWFLSIVFLVNDTLIHVDAFARAIWRTAITGTGRLEWRSAAHTARGIGESSVRASTWSVLWPSSVFAIILAIDLALYDFSTLAPALPVLLAWTLSPEIAYRMGRRRQERRDTLVSEDRDYLSLVARRTWHFFETFVGPADNWLPPDNVQPDKSEPVAHRTSPTNIGLYLTSAAAACDLGFIGANDFAIRVNKTLDALDRLETFQGHILNWYDTQTLVPLEPRYVSSVDSGNLAMCLLAVSAAARKVAQEPIVGVKRWTGIRTLLTIIAETVSKRESCPISHKPLIGDLERKIATCERDKSSWSKTIQTICDEAIPALQDTIVSLIGPVSANDEIAIWLERLAHDADRLRSDLEDFAPEAAANGEESDAEQLTIDSLRGELARAAKRAEGWAYGMNFAPLYDDDRDLLRIGYNLSAAHFDENHYDLLASEARLASFFAIAKRDIPLKHWFKLARPMRLLRRKPFLLSWSGSAFEYLMPPLFLPGHRDTLLGESEASAVQVQKQRGKARGRPWGISESGFSLKDADGTYQYRAFGTNNLGIRRSPDDDDIVAPYASALALCTWPHASVDNLRLIESLGGSGLYGFIEALDYTPARVPTGREFVPVEMFMAHHQGMTMAAIVNALENDIFVQRIFTDPKLQATELILHEALDWDGDFESVSGLDRFHMPDETEAVALPAWMPQRSTNTKRVQALGNGELTSLVASDGSGRLAFGDIELTRFTTDPALPDYGPHLYIYDRVKQSSWSMAEGAEETRTVFKPHKVELMTRRDGIAVHEDIAVLPAENAEIRLIAVVNETGEERVIDLTSYAEVVLARTQDHERHPLFSKMFVKSEYDESSRALIFMRKERDTSKSTPIVVQAIVGQSEKVRVLGYESDREEFLGRLHDNHHPVGASGKLSDTTGWILDPVSAFRIQVHVKPFETAEFAVVTSAGNTRSEALAIATRVYGPPFDSVFRMAERDTFRRSKQVGIEVEDLEIIEQFVTALFDQRIPIGTEVQGVTQPSLWRLGVSGDLPFVIAYVFDEHDVVSCADVMRAQRYLYRLGVKFDILFVRTGSEGYDEPLRLKILDFLKETDAYGHLGTRGGVHILSANDFDTAERSSLEASATLIIEADKQSFAEAIMALPSDDSDIELFEPPVHLTSECDAPELDPKLLLTNEYGGYDPKTRSYVICSQPGRPVPAPWCNVIANENFGTIVSEAGLGFTWAINSGEFKLTPWSNDPVGDPQGEAVWLRDEETGAVWTVTPSPGGGGIGKARHGMAETTWFRTSQDVEQCQTVFVPPGGDVKIVRLSVKNSTDSHKRLTATYCAAWVLGPMASTSSRHVRVRQDAENQAVLATSHWSPEFEDQIAYLASNMPVHSMSCTFSGKTPSIPLALQRWGLEEGASTTARPGGCLQLHTDLEPGEQHEFVFFLGCAKSRAQLETDLRALRQPGQIDTLRERTRVWWTKRLDRVQVQTPDAAFDALVNHWLPYQNLASRMLARAGFYQAGGAYGFRDQLQDCLALIMSEPQRARDQILRAAAHQFVEGDVLHWWHPPFGRGVRTKISDDYIWLPYVTARYVSATGDEAILDEIVPFLDAPVLGPDEHDRYASYQSSSDGSLLDHCAVALNRMMNTGRHGLPLIGTGDWNDGMDRVGDEGFGESVWLAWFQIATIDLFAPLARQHGQANFAMKWGRYAKSLRKAADNAWDGDWYRRAYDDEGLAIGSAANRECRIDSISQSWSALAQSTESHRVETALESANKFLTDDERRLVKLLDPPFGGADRDPGYIASYPPGIRENGGQYTHAAAWLGLAHALRGDIDAAYRIFDLLNPFRRTERSDGIQRYKREPYILSADIGGVAPHSGRGGWSWYTGAAGWTWQLAVHGILGIELDGGKLQIKPRLLAGWNTAEVIVRSENGSIRIQLTRAKISKHVRTRRVQFPIDGSEKTIKIDVAK